jgi:hypothetical protein
VGFREKDIFHSNKTLWKQGCGEPIGDRVEQLRIIIHKRGQLHMGSLGGEKTKKTKEI